MASRGVTTAITMVSTTSQGYRNLLGSVVNYWRMSAPKKESRKRGTAAVVMTAVGQRKKDLINWKYIPLSSFVLF